MTRNEAIETIKLFWPADSDNEPSAKLGQKLLAQAKESLNLSWEDEADAVLIKYAQLCIQHEKNM